MRLRFLTFAAALLLVACGESADTSEVFADYASAITVSATDNPLRTAVEIVFTTDCPYRIVYWKESEGELSARSTRVYEAREGKERCILKFLYPETDYCFRVQAAGSLSSDVYTFRTEAIPPEVPVYHVLMDNGGPEEGYLLQWQATSPGYLTFCDMEGRVVWYETFDQAVRHVYFDERRGEFAVLTGFREGVNSKKFQRLCDKILVVDLDGNRILEWRASEDNVPYPHHDIKMLPDGNLVIFNNVVRYFDLTPIGGEPDTAVWGEGFTVIDRSSKVLKTWDVFGAIDPVKDTYLNATVLSTDILHGNSVSWDYQGDWYITLNRHSELWKIDGSTGEVLWRFGEHGNLAFDGDWPQGGLHSSVPLAPDRVLCYNNGAGESPRSRAQIYRVSSGRAELDLDVVVDAEYSSGDRSNVELLPDGKTLMFASTLARKCTFTDLRGNPLKVISRTGIAYRSHWFEDVTF